MAYRELNLEKHADAQHQPDNSEKNSRLDQTHAVNTYNFE